MPKYEYYNFNNDRVKFSGLFNNISMDIAISNNTYLLNELNYYMAKKTILNFMNNGLNFYEIDVYDLDKIPQTYDIILLSNIYDYVGVNKSEFISYVQKKLSRILNPKGKIEVNYQYHFRQRKSKINDNLPIYYNELDSNYFDIDLIAELSNQSFSLIGVPNIYHFEREIGVEDCVYVYKR